MTDICGCSSGIHHCSQMDTQGRKRSRWHLYGDGLWLRNERMARGWSHYAIGHLMGVHHITATLWEVGRLILSAYTLQRLRDLFEAFPIVDPPPRVSADAARIVAVIERGGRFVVGHGDSCAGVSDFDPVWVVSEQREQRAAERGERRE